MGYKIVYAVKLSARNRRSAERTLLRLRRAQQIEEQAQAGTDFAGMDPASGSYSVPSSSASRRS